MSSYHSWSQIICLFVNFLAVVATTLVVLTSLALQYGFSSPIPDLLDKGADEVNAKFPTPISPTSWIYVTWFVVYIWMLLWSSHGAVSVCRSFAGVPVYVSPSLVNSPLCVFSILACGASVAWFVLYDREYITTATLMGLCVTCFAWTAYIISVYTLHEGLHRLKKSERMREAWLHRILVQNGLALLAVWSFLLSVLNLCTTLIHNDEIKMDEETAAVVCLSVIAFYMVLSLVLDVAVLDRFTRYTFLHYLVPIAVMCSVIFRQDAWPSQNAVFIQVATLVAFSFLAIMFKAACVACRVMTSPHDEDDAGAVDDDLTGGQYYLSSASSTGYLTEGRYLLRN